MKTRYWLAAPVLCLAALAPVRAQDGKAKEWITKETQQAIDAGLAYLAEQQAADGSWGTGQLKGNVGITSLAARAFLAGGLKAGQGKYRANLTKAVEFILSQENKDVPGFLHNGQAGVHGPMYGHGYAVLFLAEVHGTITDRKLKERVKAALDRAVRLTLTAQNKEGGWRYQPRPADADLTVTAGQLQALWAAKAAGADVPDETLAKGVKYVLSCQDEKEGGFHYIRQVGLTGFARSAAAIVALHSGGVKKGDALKNGLDYLLKFRPDAANANKPELLHYYYGHYYAAQAMWTAGGTYAEKWYPAARTTLLKHPERQVLKDGAQCCWVDRQICTHYATAMALIVLQTPHNRVTNTKN
jgi:hypothetical protein